VKLVTFSTSDGRARLGAWTADATSIADLAAANRARTGRGRLSLAGMRRLIEAGPAALQCARVALAFAEQERAPGLTYDAAAVRLLAPLPDPVMLRCCSLFRGHHLNCRATMMAWNCGVRPDPSKLELPPMLERLPGWYKGNHLSLIGPEDDIIWPWYGERLDFELELALVVGRGGVDIHRDQFGDYVFGWSVFNDVSARDPQIAEMTLGTGPTKGKDFDTGNVIGPCIVTADAFDPARARANARINGETWGSGDASDMLHAWADVLAYRSRSERLHPAEIITSGAFTNCSGIEHDRYLAPGDVIELEIEGIGVLRNRVVKP
jgi:2-keto-4-pentenoate hydratase/2-oxohepta-3-ene-1,7-dioic acid hydratase in catechol pathway